MGAKWRESKEGWRRQVVLKEGAKKGGARKRRRVEEMMLMEQLGRPDTQQTTKHFDVAPSVSIVAIGHADLQSDALL